MTAPQALHKARKIARSRGDILFKIYTIGLFFALYGIGSAVPTGLALKSFLETGSTDLFLLWGPPGAVFICIGCALCLGVFQGPMGNSPFLAWLCLESSMTAGQAAVRLTYSRLLLLKALIILWCTIVLWNSRMLWGGILVSLGMIFLSGLIALIICISWMLGQLGNLNLLWRFMGPALILLGVISITTPMLLLNDFTQALDVGAQNVAIWMSISILLLLAILLFVVLHLKLKSLHEMDLIAVLERSNGHRVAFISGNTGARGALLGGQPNRGPKTAISKGGSLKTSLNIIRLTRYSGAKRAILSLAVSNAILLILMGVISDSALRREPVVIILVLIGILSYWLFQLIPSSLSLARDWTSRRCVLGWSPARALWNLNKDILILSLSGALISQGIVFVVAQCMGNHTIEGTSLTCGAIVACAALCARAEELRDAPLPALPSVIPSPFGDLGGMFHVLKMVQGGFMAALLPGLFAVTLGSPTLQIYVTAFFAIGFLLWLIAHRIVGRDHSG